MEKEPNRTGWSTLQKAVLVTLLVILVVVAAIWLRGKVERSLVICEMLSQELTPENSPR